MIQRSRPATLTCRTATVGFLVVVTALSLAACSAKADESSQATPSIQSLTDLSTVTLPDLPPGPTPTGTATEDVAQALETWNKYWAARGAISRQPPKTVFEALDPPRNLQDYGAGRLYGTDIKMFNEFGRKGFYYKGTYPDSRAAFIKTGLRKDGAKEIYFEICVDPNTDWMRYDSQGKAAPKPIPSGSPLPRPGVVTVVKSANKWMATNLETDSSRSCKR